MLSLVLLKIPLGIFPTMSQIYLFKIFLRKFSDLQVECYYLLVSLKKSKIFCYLEIFSKENISKEIDKVNLSFCFGIDKSF